MTTKQIETRLTDAKEDFDVAYRLFRKGSTEEAKELLAKCFELRMSVYGGIGEVIGLMEQFDMAHNELFKMFYANNQTTA